MEAEIELLKLEIKYWKKMVALQNPTVDATPNLDNPHGDPDLVTVSNFLPLDKMTELHIANAMYLANFNMTSAAQLLKIDRTSLYRRIKLLAFSEDDSPRRSRVVRVRDMILRRKYKQSQWKYFRTRLLAGHAAHVVRKALREGSEKGAAKKTTKKSLLKHLTDPEEFDYVDNWTTEDVERLVGSNDFRSEFMKKIENRIEKTRKTPKEPATLAKPDLEFAQQPQSGYNAVKLPGELLEQFRKNLNDRDRSMRIQLVKKAAEEIDSRHDENKNKREMGLLRSNKRKSASSE